MSKRQLVLLILAMIALQAVTAYMVVKDIVVPKIAALHAPPAEATAIVKAPADTTTHLFSIAVGLDRGIATTYEVALLPADAQTKRAIEQNAPQIETTLKNLLNPVRAEDLNDPVKTGGIQKNLIDAVNKLIAPMRITDLSIRLQPM